MLQTMKYIIELLTYRLMLNHNTNNNQDHDNVSSIVTTASRNMEAICMNKLQQYNNKIIVRHILQSSINVRHRQSRLAY